MQIMLTSFCSLLEYANKSILALRQDVFNVVVNLYHRLIRML